MQLKVINSFLAKTVLDDDVIGLTPLKAGRYPIKAIEDEGGSWPTMGDWDVSIFVG